MSDCSTRATELKERTCGTCANGLRVVDYSGKRSSCICEYNTRTRCTDVALLHGLDDECQFHPNSGAYRPRVEPDLEQRCQQLEQVARDLYDSAWCAWFLKINAEMPELEKGMKERAADSYLQNEREHLEALGVSVDD